MSRPDPGIFNSLRDDLTYFEQLAEIVAAWEEPRPAPIRTSEEQDKVEREVRAVSGETVDGKPTAKRGRPKKVEAPAEV